MNPKIEALLQDILTHVVAIRDANRNGKLDQAIGLETDLASMESELDSIVFEMEEE